MSHRTQVVVIGGGPAGLAAGYHLRRLGLDFVILDARTTPGGAWQHTWDSLRLFSPAAYSSLPGHLMPPQAGETYPDAQHVVECLTDHEKRYELPSNGPCASWEFTGTADSCGWRPTSPRGRPAS